jgi:hypothetical protein
VNYELYPEESSLADIANHARGLAYRMLGKAAEISGLERAGVA